MAILLAGPIRLGLLWLTSVAGIAPVESYEGQIWQAVLRALIVMPPAFYLSKNRWVRSSIAGAGFSLISITFFVVRDHSLFTGVEFVLACLILGIHWFCGGFLAAWLADLVCTRVRLEPANQP